jgi:hypothetical protein
MKVAIRSLLVLMLTLALAAAAGADELRWKFKEGETLDYVLKRGVEGKITLSGAEIAFVLEMIFDTNWKATSVAADGTAAVDLTVDRIQVDMNSPLGGQLAYDSKAEKEPEGPVWAQLGPVMKGMLGQTFKAKISPLGVVADIELPAALKEVLAKQEVGENRRQGFGIGGNAFNEKGIKELIVQSVLPLPDKAENGATWSRAFENELPMMGKQTSETTFTYAGMEQVNSQNLAKVTAVTEVLFEPAEDPRAELEIVGQEAQATYYFDPAAGHLINSEGVQQMQMEISGQQELTQEIAETVSMRLGKSPDKKPSEPPADKAK